MFLMLKNSVAFTLVTLLLTSSVLHAQEIKAGTAKAPITVDGIIGEKEWQGAGIIRDFYQIQPEYGAEASFPTTVYILYDSKNFYAGIVCRDPNPEKITAKITKRDGDLKNDDSFAIMLDTFFDKNNAYIFVINSLGTQLDGRIADNGRTVDIKWDTEWKSASRVNENGWSAEIAIPFKSIKYKNNGDVWGINVGRSISRLMEFDFSSRNLVNMYRVSQFRPLTNMSKVSPSVKQYSIIPYVQAQFKEGEKMSSEAGFDLRYNPVSNIGLEVTVNPDFATIEGDVERVNLSRFEMSYPEKRPFFLEGAENYQTRIRQFYSRRIGEIPWGVKVSGKVGKFKINGLVTQSDPSTAGAEVSSGEDATYSVFRINREFKKGSTIGILGANRNYCSENKGSVGLVATLFFSKLVGMTSQVIKTYGPDQNPWTFFLRPAYDSQFMHFHIRYSHYGVGVKENVNPVGFIRDDDRKEFDTNLTRTFWINKYGIDSIEPSINYNRYYSQKGNLRSYDTYISVETAWSKKWSFDLSYNDQFYAAYGEIFEKDFHNWISSAELQYDNKKGMILSAEYSKGFNFDRDLEVISGSIDLSLMKGWNAEYRFERNWFRPFDPEDNSWIHYVRTSYYLNKDMFFKLFWQTKHRMQRNWFDSENELLRKTFQVVFVWRFLPPFGSVQLAYQEGTFRYTETEASGRTLFTKLSWVF